MGNERSGRYPKGTKIVNKKGFDLKKTKDILKIKNEPQKTVVQKVETKIESLEENLDFDSNASRILAESQAAIAAEAPKKDALQNQNPEVIQKPKKEDWTPVAGMIMHLLGGLFENSTGVKELNYTSAEIEECSPAISDLINVWFPDADALTEDQKVILISASVIAKVHMEKLKIYFDHKKQKALDDENKTQSQPAAA